MINALHKAVRDALISASPTLGVEVYSGLAPQNASFPYISIGDVTNVNADTDDVDGFECVITIHAWAKSMRVVNDLLTRIHETLHRATPSVDGFTCPGLSYEDSTSFPDEDVTIRHGVITFRTFLHK